jgi:glucan phosphoethanolaminetransferase (alkaline phosphatase superfamily)
MGVSLFVVFVIAKIAALWDRQLAGGAWILGAYVWQDTAVALVFSLVCRWMPRPQWPARTVYAALVALTAIDVPVVRVLGSPLTVPMVRAARGTLSASIAYYATPANLALVALVAVLGASLSLLPKLMSGARPRGRWRLFVSRPGGVAPAGPIMVAIGMCLTMTGAYAGTRVDTGGLHRNPLVALAESILPRIAPQPLRDDWRTSPLGADAIDDLPVRGHAAAGRNVVLVVLESTAARYLRTYGAREDPTPNLTRLAARAIVFENTYAVYPESVKGLVAILASRYPAFDIPAEGHANSMSPSLASRLGAAGYTTGLFHSGRFMYLGMDALLARAGFEALEDAGDIGGDRESSFGIDEGAAVRRLLSWIDARPAGHPFFAAYLPIAGHHPYSHERPGPFSEIGEIGRYRNALLEGDHALGDLLAGIRARGLDESTVIVVIADHGEAFGQHRGNMGHTLELYDENVRVPLLIALPDGEGAGVRDRRVASLLDLAPTILDLVAVDAPTAFQGRSLLSPQPRMALFFTDYSLGLLGLRDGCAKFVFEIASKRSSLFDICRDPDERVDASLGRPDAVRRYRERLLRWSAAQVSAVGLDRATPRPP